MFLIFITAVLSTVKAAYAVAVIEATDIFWDGANVKANAAVVYWDVNDRTPMTIPSCVGNYYCNYGIGIVGKSDNGVLRRISWEGCIFMGTNSSRISF